jgi:NAD(P) transhydrogenase
MQRFDLLVVGSGPAGHKAAIQAAKLGKRVAIVERSARIGGGAVHTGTIPSKTLREAALYLSGWDQRGLYGSGYRLKEQLTIEDLMQRLDITVRHEVDILQHQLARNGVSIIHGNAHFADPHTLHVETPGGRVEAVEGDCILLATGSRPKHPPDVDFDDPGIIDSDQVLRLEHLPRSMTVIGAGVIGVEYATIFSTLDVQVTLVDGRERLLEFMDRELVDELVHLLRDRGMVLRLGEQVAAVERLDDSQLLTRLESGKQVRSEVVMFAAGRIGCTSSLRLEKAGLEADRRHRIAVSDTLQTAVPHIYAAGDVIGFPALASTSMHQGRRVACHAFGRSGCEEVKEFPFGIYSVPEMSMIGTTEAAAAEQGIAYETGVARLRETARGQIMGLQDGLLKLVIGLEDRRLLGVHILGEGATELIHIGQTALHLGAGLEYFLETVFNYPTLAEAYQIAALDAWNRIGH